MYENTYLIKSNYEIDAKLIEGWFSGEKKLDLTAKKIVPRADEILDYLGTFKDGVNEILFEQGLTDFQKSMSVDYLYKEYKKSIEAD